MGLRYVWEKWNTTTDLGVDTPTVWGVGCDSTGLFSVSNQYTIDYWQISLKNPTKINLVLGDTYTVNEDIWLLNSQGTSEGEYLWVYFISNDTIISHELNERNEDFLYFSKVAVEYKAVRVKGNTSYGNISSSSSGAYPENSYSGSYWYVSKGSDTIDPVSVSYSSSIQGGQTVEITINPSIGNVYGGTIKYKVEYQLNGGSWKVANSGTTSKNLSILVPAGTQTFRARATASDNMGFTSTTAVTGATVSVVNNAAPVINCGTSSLGEIAEPLSVTYSVSDEDGDTMTITEKIDGTTIRSYSAPSGSSGEQTFNPSAAQWLTTLNGSHTATITADDGKGGVTTHSISFTRAVYTMSVTLEEPMETDAAITKCVVNIARNLPVDAEWSLLVTNNAFDPDPVWEDITQYVKNGWNWVFENQTVTSGRYGFNFKLTCARGASGQGGSVDTISGGFE